MVIKFPRTVPTVNYFTGLVVPLGVVAAVLGVLFYRWHRAAAANDASTGLPTRGKLILLAACIVVLLGGSLFFLPRDCQCIREY